MHEKSSSVTCLQVYLEEKDLIFWDKDEAPDTGNVMERAISHDTKLIAYFKTNKKYPKTRNFV